MIDIYKTQIKDQIPNLLMEYPYYSTIDFLQFIRAEKIEKFKFKDIEYDCDSDQIFTGAIYKDFIIDNISHIGTCGTVILIDGTRISVASYLELYSHDTIIFKVLVLHKTEKEMLKFKLKY